MLSRLCLTRQLWVFGAVRDPRGAGIRVGLSLRLRNPYSHPAIWVVSIKRGSTRAFSPVPAGRGVRPAWIVAI